MSSRFVYLRNGLVFAACLSLSLVGCGSPSTGLPGKVTITFPDGTTVEAEKGDGVTSLANSQWQFFQTGATQAFVTVAFGPDGNLESFEENTIAQEIFGSRIRFDGRRHNAARQGLEYAAATYGAETDDATTFAFEGRLSVFAAGIKAATAKATATATYDAEDPDTVEGTFTFSVNVTISGIAEIPDDTFSFVGRRVTE